MNTGILGGTFDPIHSGHLYLARVARRMFSLDEVILMPARIPPHKTRHEVSSGFHRFAMAALAAVDEPGVTVSPWELSRGGPSYTVDTLTHFASSFPDDQFCFIAGGDSLKELHLWREYDRLLTEFSFVFFERAGVQTRTEDLLIAPSLRGRLHTVCETERLLIQSGTSYLVRSSPPSISSTRLRQLISAGLDPDPGILPSHVFTYIRKHRLYE